MLFLGERCPSHASEERDLQTFAKVRGRTVGRTAAVSQLLGKSRRFGRSVGRRRSFIFAPHSIRTGGEKEWAESASAATLTVSFLFVTPIDPKFALAKKSGPSLAVRSAHSSRPSAVRVRPPMRARFVSTPFLVSKVDLSMHPSLPKKKSSA